jgi:hypothetical protein
MTAIALKAKGDMTRTVNLEFSQYATDNPIPTQIERQKIQMKSSDKTVVA